MGRREPSYEALQRYQGDPGQLTGSVQVDPARMAYFRSDENFLYFNPTVQYAPGKA